MMNSVENYRSLPPPVYGTPFNSLPSIEQLSRRRVLLAKFVKHFTSKRVFVVLIIALVLASVELAYGLKYDGQCPYRPQITLFLTVHGIAKLVSCCTIILAYAQGRCFANYRYLYELMLINIAIHLVFGLFFIVWFILGNIWIWTVNTDVIQSTDPTQTSTYCEDKLYQAAKHLLIVHYIIFGVGILIVIAGFLYTRYRKHAKIRAQQEAMAIPPYYGRYELEQRW